MVVRNAARNIASGRAQHCEWSRATLQVVARNTASGRAQHCEWSHATLRVVERKVARIRRCYNMLSVIIPVLNYIRSSCICVLPTFYASTTVWTISEAGFLVCTNARILCCHGSLKVYLQDTLYIRIRFRKNIGKLSAL